MKKKIGIIIGDPAGVGPEIVCKAISDYVSSNSFIPVLIGSSESLSQGMKVAGKQIQYKTIDDYKDIESLYDGIALVDDDEFHLSNLQPGKLSVEIGRVTLRMLEVAVELLKRNLIDAIVYAPINKRAINLANNIFSDELEVFKNLMKFNGLALEMNYSSNIWTARCTGHIPLMEVSKNLDSGKIVDVIRLTQATLLEAKVDKPRILVAALNPHGGEGGNFGDEEIKIITPAIEEAKSEGILVKGPIPADVIFDKAFSGECDAVVTMYHDQGQIALKTKSFAEGITYLAGLPYPVFTVGHGVGYDIAFQGIAKEDSMKNAIDVANRIIS